MPRPRARGGRRNRRRDGTGAKCPDGISPLCQGQGRDPAGWRGPWPRPDTLPGGCFFTEREVCECNGPIYLEIKKSQTGLTSISHTCKRPTSVYHNNHFTTIYFSKKRPRPSGRSAGSRFDTFSLKSIEHSTPLPRAKRRTKGCMYSPNFTTPRKDWPLCSSSVLRP